MTTGRSGPWRGAGGAEPDGSEDARLAVLGTLWSAWARLGAELTDAQWDRPTRGPTGRAVRGEGPEALAAAWRTGPAVVDYSGLALLRLGEAASIGVMEATVHLLDLRHALDQPPDVPAEGLAHTVSVLAGMAPPVDFIVAATGRHAGALFPLLT